MHVLDLVTLSVVWLATELWKVPTQRQGRCSLIGQKIFCALRCFLLVLKSELELRALVYLALLRSKFLARAAFAPRLDYVYVA